MQVVRVYVFMTSSGDSLLEFYLREGVSVPVKISTGLKRRQRAKAGEIHLKCACCFSLLLRLALRTLMKDMYTTFVSGGNFKQKPRTALLMKENNNDDVWR